MRVLVCGDRHWTDENEIRRHLVKLKDHVGLNLFVISGGNGNGEKGADSICERLCDELGIDHVVFPANWNGRGKAAGPFRNKLMASLQPDLCLAFHGYLPGSKGTRGMVDICRDQGVDVEVVPPTTRARVRA